MTPTPKWPGNLSDADLIQHHANADTTYARSLGNKKRDRNYDTAQALYAEIRRRGLQPLPDEAGVFNGPGSV